MKKFTINEKEYDVKPFDFNFVCDLEDLGFSLADAGTKPMALLRAYFAVCADESLEYAGKEMEAHMISGGNFEDVLAIIANEMTNSDFFQAFTKNGEEKATKNTSKKTTKTA